MDCSGLQMKRETIEWKEGGINDHVHILPGRTSYEPIVLKRGITLSTALWDWYQWGLYTGLVNRIKMSIILYNTQREVVRRWNIQSAFPIEWNGPQLKSDGNELAVETLKIAHHGLALG